jgi:hypothetical protein
MTMHIPTHPISSSQIHSIGHDPATNTCAICFKGKDGAAGSVYHYENVDAATFEAFKSAKSLGRHFGEHFKKNEKHPYAKQEQPKKAEA